MSSPRASLLLAVLAACDSETAFVGRTQVDTFQQTPNDEVDIVFVIDQSSSMAEEQRALIQSFGSFLEELEAANSKFHLAVLSTDADTDDPHRGEFRGDPPWLDVEDDYQREFASRALLGTTGSDKEKGLSSLAWALSPELLAGHNTGFLRDEASLLAVVVSDEEDCSDEGTLDGMDSSACYANQGLLHPVLDYVDQLVDAKHGQRDRLRFGAIVTPALDDPNCSSGATGYRYARMVQELGGTIGNVCETDWSDMLYELGLTASGVLNTFELSRGAVTGTLVVTVNDVDVPEDPTNGFTYDQNASLLTFHGSAVPPRGAQITVTYEIAY